MTFSINLRRTLLSFFFFFWPLCGLSLGLYYDYDFFQKTGELHLSQNSRLELRLATQVFRSRSVQKPYPLKRLPEHLVDFLIFQEDQSFYEHRGYSLRDIMVVLRDYAWRGHRLRGASTLTQQLARSLFLGHEKSLWRKLMELRITHLLETKLSKSKILELYFNHVYWGRGAYGIGRASQSYFGRGAGHLSPRQSMFLISILPHPSACPRPISCNDKGVLRRMERLQKYYQR